MTTGLSWSNKQRYGLSNKYTKIATHSRIQMTSRHNRCSPEKKVKLTPPFCQRGSWTFISPKYPNKSFFVPVYPERTGFVYDICLTIWNVSLLVTLLKWKEIVIGTVCDS